MNNEKLLYDLIKANGGELACRDAEIADKIGKSRYAIPVYKRKLKDNGFIETKVRVVDNRCITLYRIIKEYNGEIHW